LLPKIHRNSMLPARCRMEPCRNMEAKTANQTFLSGKTSRESGLATAEQSPVLSSRTVAGSP
jgi:hypothetical protein